MYTLKYFVELEDPDFIFLNETQISQADIAHVMDIFKGEYCHALNSEDTHDPELALIKTKANGGTMILWKRSLNESITVLPVKTSQYSSILQAVLLLFIYLCIYQHLEKNQSLYKKSQTLGCS